jgi:hypothetical protein
VDATVAACLDSDRDAFFGVPTWVRRDHTPAQPREITVPA